MAAQTQPRRSSPPRSLGSRLPLHWSWFALMLLLLGYWIFVHQLERVDGQVVLARLFLPELTPAQATRVSFNATFVWLIEMFHPRVLRHFIPVVVGWWLAVQAAISLIQVLYHCPDRRTAAEFLRRQRRGRIPSTELPYVATQEELAKDREQSILLNVGGPVRVQIPNGFAGVTERNSRFLRVLRPGVHDLLSFEYLRELVDLRPQTRESRNVTMLTREGIPLQCDLIAIEFQIDPGAEPSRDRPFPLNERAVRNAAYAGPGWSNGPLGLAVGATTAYVGKLTLDELLHQTDIDAHQLLTDTVTEIVWDKLRNADAAKGGIPIRPLRLRIGSLTPPPEVTRQYTEYWLTLQQKEDMIARANGTANLLQEAEMAQAAAEILMLQSIVEGIRQAQQEAGTNVSSYLLVVRLLEALRRMFRHSVEGLPREDDGMAQLLEEIHSVEERLSELTEEVQQPPIKFNPSRSD